MDGADAIKYILDNSIEGDVVECGVGDGHFEVIFINELQKNNTIRDIFLYDTFAGLTVPGSNDYTADTTPYGEKWDASTVYNTWASQKLTDTINGWCYYPLEQVQNRLKSTGYPEDKLHFIVGDIMETLKHKSNIPDKIAILRLDTDWYESSKFELEQMYNNVVTGGLIIFDDYYHWDGQRRATDEYFESINIKYDFVKIQGKTAAIIKK
jgi:SAM-dependent methyltransferase